MQDAAREDGVGEGVEQVEDAGADGDEGGVADAEGVEDGRDGGEGVGEARGDGDWG